MKREWLKSAREVLDELENCEVSPSELVTIEVTLEALTATLEQIFFDDEETVYGLSDLLSELQENSKYGEFIPDDLPDQASKLVETCSMANYWEDHEELPDDLKEQLTASHEKLIQSISKLLDTVQREA